MTVVKGGNTHGTPLFYMVKRHLTPQLPLFHLWSSMLQEFEVGLHTYKTFPADTVSQHKPPHAPVDPTFEPRMRPPFVLVLLSCKLGAQPCMLMRLQVPSLHSLRLRRGHAP